ncbi:dihydroxyacetone kinase [Fistulina hepatica ATCC 64428]|uniref:Dihydroxyacetone kinase n=1 Tax=Fistulina hepatica ATCC 64428 TaxID=1128425 RepID=A0A0D7A2Q9_9AGAR|nr:dihydroxyacetone kinase [Fistulina hepatica ATCC 64428]
MDRHVFSDHATLVVRSLQGLVASHPTLSLIPSIRTVIDANYDTTKVTTISGGGAGHEPGFAAFVGRGLLTAAVSGDIFASPSARQVYGAVKAVPSTKGTILIITNYTGDNLHFGLACQQARADGISNIAILPVGDDVSVGRTKGALVGRRAMAGTMLVCKILGAASEADWGFQEILDLGRAVAGNVASIGCTLGHCHIPGRGNYACIPADTIEIGLGLHNEPGVWVIKPQPSADELIARMLKLILDKEDPERSFVPFDAGDECVLLVNNMGGMSMLEMYAIVDETLAQLQAQGVIPVRVYCGSFLTSLNALGFSLSLLNLSCIAKTASNVDELITFLDAPQTGVAWPASTVYPVPASFENRKREDKFISVPKEKATASTGEPELQVSPETLASVMRAGAIAVMQSEPDLTRWDTIVGDGDCGETCYNGAKAVIDALNSGLGCDGELVGLLRKLTEIIDHTCGGTLGAIFSIFLAALTAEVRKEAETNVDVTVDLKFWGRTSTAAIETLKQSTKARVGHRTVMDALIPFVEALATASTFSEAAAACKAGGEGTAKLTAKLGRATYVGDNGNLPPDPGAMSLVFLVAGIDTVLSK